MNVSYPDWLSRVVDWTAAYATLEERMALAIGVSLANVAQGGGPFGAVICDADGRVVAAGYNRVVQDVDLTAHSEVVAIRNAQRELATYDLRNASRAPLDLFASVTPCIMCYGVIWLAGLRHVYAAANNEDSRAAGFVHGYVSREMWDALERETSTRFTGEFCRGERSMEPLLRYARTGGRVYA